MSDGERDIGTIEKQLRRHTRDRRWLLENTLSHVDRSTDPAIRGLILLLPILILVLLAQLFLSYLSLLPQIELIDVTGILFIDQMLRLAVSLGAVAALLTVTGYLVNTGIGRRLEWWVDQKVGAIPFFGAVYSGSKMLMDKVLLGTGDFQSPIKIDFGGVRVTGFRTGKQAGDGRSIVFIPTAPNITTGIVAEIPDYRLEETDEDVQSAFARIISAGFGGREEFLADQAQAR